MGNAARQWSDTAGGQPHFMVRHCGFSWRAQRRMRFAGSRAGVLVPLTWYWSDCVADRQTRLHNGKTVSARQPRDRIPAVRG